MEFAPHFPLNELIKSDEAVRLGIDNTPPANVIDHLKVLSNGLEQVRALLNQPMNISSGYRCEALERVLCKKDFIGWCGRHGRMSTDVTAWSDYYAGKAHPKGYAADWTSHLFGDPRTIISTLVASPLRFDLVIYEGTWVHSSFDPSLRRLVRTATFKDGTPSYQEGLA